MTTPSGWFTTEIQQMMYGFGNSRKSLPETAVLVEEIIQQQMAAMIEKASVVSVSRGDKHISIEDILFLLRKDKIKLKRLLKFYEVKDMKGIIKSTMGLTEDGSNKSELNIISGQEKQVLDQRTMGKNRQTCYDFLSLIDQTGELVALFDDKEVDMVKHERMLRAEMQAQGMDTERYMEFCQARQANFGRRYKIQRFRDWLQLSLGSDIVLSPAVVEVFSYLAYETVAQIVDLALLVKQDQRAHPGDPLSKTRPPLCVNYAELYAGSQYGKPEASGVVSQSPPYDSSNAAQMLNPAANSSSMQVSTALTPSKVNKKKRKKSGPATSVEMSWNWTILPSDVREAMRRYYTDIGPFASQIKVNPQISHWYTTLCS